jgi:hypothetical protein
MDGLGSASPPVAPTATTGEGRHPCTWPRTFWFKPLSAFGLLDLTTFISSSPELAMPSTLAPDRLGASSRRVLSREPRPPGSGEVTLSQEFRTVGLLRPHVLVGYQWSHAGLCAGCRPVITDISAASCRTPLYFSMSPKEGIARTKSTDSSPLAAAQPLTTPSWLAGPTDARENLKKLRRQLGLGNN